jgi:hypothetical protein
VAPPLAQIVQPLLWCTILSISGAAKNLPGHRQFDRQRLPRREELILVSSIMMIRERSLCVKRFLPKN